ncbi:MAG: hypothetical protein HC934_12235 [Acaryochloridaceae cyanobacterium SU_2_1]|nr:hypothetical protein [Acaryochloridaceae cyanobacterium SU_2_1]NJM95370.1 hypothetical protein [Acaryochloridaceae cyanobacterium CSU_5_19]
MSRSKLSDSDKQTIIQLFQQSQETLAQLATRYNVSSSTIRRLLKNNLPDQEYESLLATKQDRRSPKPPASPQEPAVTRSSKPIKLIPAIPVASPASVDLDLTLDPPSLSQDAPSIVSGDLAEIIAEFNDDIKDQDFEDEDPEGYDPGDDDLEDFDSEEAEESDSATSLRPATELEVIPVAAAKFPKSCYLVVDRSGELITCPLKDFSELGQIPAHEVNATTLPIFDNHRVARRFSHRTQRIIKVPNSNLLTKTYGQLSAKGISRLLINGHVYAL